MYTAWNPWKIPIEKSNHLSFLVIATRSDQENFLLANIIHAQKRWKLNYPKKRKKKRNPLQWVFLKDIGYSMGIHIYIIYLKKEKWKRSLTKRLS